MYMHEFFPWFFIYLAWVPIFHMGEDYFFLRESLKRKNGISEVWEILCDIGNAGTLPDKMTVLSLSFPEMEIYDWLNVIGLPAKEEGDRIGWVAKWDKDSWSRETVLVYSRIHGQFLPLNFNVKCHFNCAL